MQRFYNKPKILIYSCNNKIPIILVSFQFFSIKINNNKAAKLEGEEQLHSVRFHNRTAIFFGRISPSLE